MTRCGSCRPVDALALTIVNGALVCARCDGLPLWPNLQPTAEDRRLVALWKYVKAARDPGGDPGGLQRLADGLRAAAEEDA